MYLFDALVTLKAVQNVEWTPHYKESEDTQCTVMKALQILPNLRSARFTVGHCKIPLQLDALTTIQEVSLSGTCTKDIDHDATLRSLARLVGASSLLTAIGVANNWRRSQDGAQVNLHALLALRPKSAQPLYLRRLSIQCVMVRLDEVTLPHLQYLRALSLTRIEDPCHLERQAVKYGSQGLDETMLSREGCGSTSVLDEVWRALQDAGIWLEELIVDAVVPALLDYLASYGGLQKLVLKPGGFEDSASSDAVAEEFYGRVLGNHATTLQDLEINALYEGKWCVAPHNLDVIALCGDLRTLRMSVGYGQVGLPSGPGGDKGNDFVKLFLDTVALHLPQLDQVHIDVANLEELRAAFCGNPVIAHFAHTTRAMAECVSRYRAHDSCLQLPAKLSIGNPAHQFVVAHHHVGSDGEIGKGAVGRILRYVDVTPPAERHLNLDYGCW
ncbi:hypothetical protein BDN70DRAFT_859473 [Pholiota conissans]|uniref:Uncharacterized protein n=1 Tax=Pholiota conissans TaxID=109636 RepID=A0A9P6CZV8_9AGAR|nr:hypothetical protein BDN70DRAFT_859473 [Pholiota conissans]